MSLNLRWLVLLEVIHIHECHCPLSSSRGDNSFSLSVPAGKHYIKTLSSLSIFLLFIKGLLFSFLGVCVFMCKWVQVLEAARGVGSSGSGATQVLGNKFRSCARTHALNCWDIAPALPTHLWQRRCVVNLNNSNSKNNLNHLKST